MVFPVSAWLVFWCLFQWESQGDIQIHEESTKHGAHLIQILPKRWDARIK